MTVHVTAGSVRSSDRSTDALVDFVHRYPRLSVLTGAGCCTDSGIPDYRDAAGEWKRRHPVMFQDFIADDRAPSATGRGVSPASAACGVRARTRRIVRWRVSRAVGGSHSSSPKTSMGCTHRSLRERASRVHVITAATRRRCNHSDAVCAIPLRCRCDRSGITRGCSRACVSGNALAACAPIAASSPPKRDCHTS